MRIGPSLFLILPVATTLHAQSTSRGVQLFQSNDWARARGVFSAVLQKNEKDAAAHYWMGRLAIVDNDADEAATHLERAIALDSTVADYHMWYGRATAAKAARAGMMEQMSLAPKVKAEYERAVALDPKSVDARDALLDFYSIAPAMMGGGPERALEQATAIAAMNPMRGHLAMGRIAMRAKDTTAVERELNAAIAAAPDTLRIYSTLASWYISQKQWPQAFAAIERYLKRRPDDLHGLNAIGRVAAASGQQLERGEKGIRAYVSNPPKDASNPSLSLAWFRLGQILQHEGKAADAKGAFERATQLDSHNDEAKKALAAAGG